MEKEERDERIRALLSAGHRQIEVVRQLGLTPSVVSRVAVRAGFRARPNMPARYDWAAIRSYYDAGHSIRECREQFGFSAGAWDQAVTRGDVVPRAVRDPANHSHETRQRVASELADGLTQAEVARKLGISKGTVAFHARRLGVEPDPRFARRFNWEAIQQAYDTGLSLTECAERFGFSKASWCQAVQRGDLKPRPRLHQTTKSL
jgi:DNA-binding CsgD family transcriptional regulator